MRSTTAWGALALAIVMAPAAWAAPQLVVTEIYMGTPGSDVTEDWFEITNVGDMAWAAAPLFYDDVSSDVVDAVAIANLGAIQPSESVVVVIGDLAAVAEFATAWDDSGQLSGVQIGYADGGKGLGQSGDGVTVFDDITPPTGNVIAYQTYGSAGALGSTLIYNPVSSAFGENAVVGQFGAYQAPAGAAGDSGEYPLIGSPGVLPEPATMTLIGLGAIAILRRKG